MSDINLLIERRTRVAQSVEASAVACHLGLGSWLDLFHVLGSRKPKCVMVLLDMKYKG